MIKYNSKYNRYASESGEIYKLDKSGNYIKCKEYNRAGYLRIAVNRKYISSHRLIWETFNGEIPVGMEIDHINTVRNDNRLSNLRCVSHAENNSNPLTRQHNSEARIGRRFSTSDFGIKFKEHYGITKSDDTKLYDKEHHWYKSHNNKCRWE